MTVPATGRFQAALSPRSRALIAWSAAVCLVGPIGWGLPAAAQTMVDSTSTALDDSLAIPSPDSLVGETPDSSSALPSDLPAPSASTPSAPGWTPSADPLALAALRRQHHETLDDVLRQTPGVSLRVDGDRGMPAHLSFDPLDPGWGEFLYDGVPTLNPADEESGLWDLPAAAVRDLVVEATAPTLLPGMGALRIESERGIEGRTYMRTKFSSAPNETFYRAVSLRTPREDRQLGLDFGEWKTDEGALFTVSPNLGGFADTGRSKMRHFDLRGGAATGLGWVGLHYGRGTRFYRGSVSSPETVERWNGRLALGLDHTGGARTRRLRLYHLDWHVDDSVHAELRDASRRGIRYESRPRGGNGLFVSVTGELRAARFADTTDTVHVEPQRLAGMWLSYRTSSSRGDQAVAGVQVLHAENSSEEVGWGGWGELGWAPGERTRVSVGARRLLRAPSLLESDGWSTWDTVVPTTSGYDPTVTSFRRRSSGPLPNEIQDLVFIRTSDRWWGARWTLGLEHWRLRDGLAWRRTSSAEGEWTGSARLDRTQVVGTLLLGRRWGAGELHLSAFGHRVLGELRHDESRGGGWPLYASTVRLGASSSFFSSHNRLGMDVVSRVLGPRFDDRHVILGASDPAVHQLDLDVSLVIRDAEIRISWDNLLDQRLEEVLGTFRRGRQMRLSLRWDFFN